MKTSSFLYADVGSNVIRMACPYCRIVSLYDVDFIENAIKENKHIVCIACEERFEIVLQKKSTSETKRVPNFSSGEVVCECGEKFSLFYNGGELDTHTCKCGLIYKTEHRQIDLVIYKQ